MVRYGAFRPLKWAISQGEMVLFAKRGMVLKHKVLLFNGLSKVLIIRVFAVEGESARKYALIFWGIMGN